LRLARGEILEYALFGLFALAVLQWLYLEAIGRMNVGLAVVIQYTAPFLIAVWLRTVRHQPQGGIVWVGLGVALVGLVLVLGVGGSDFHGVTRAGLAFAVASSLFFAYYALHASRLLARRPAPAVLAIGGSFAIVIWNVTAAPIWAWPTAPLYHPIALGGALHWSISGWLLLTLSVVFGGAVPYGLFLSGMRLIGPRNGTTTMMLEPVSAVAVGWLWLEQTLTGLQLVGAAVVLGAVLIVQFRSGTSEPTAEPV